MNSPSFANLPDAVIGFLRSLPGVATAFGEDLTFEATTKLWRGKAPHLTERPYLVYRMVAEVFEHTTGRPKVASGQFQVSITADTDVEADDLSWLVLGSPEAPGLNRAPLVFSRGELMTLTVNSRVAQDVENLGTEGQVTVYQYVLVFDYKINYNF